MWIKGVYISAICEIKTVQKIERLKEERKLNRGQRLLMGILFCINSHITHGPIAFSEKSVTSTL